jgi:inorganic pyrophosphatase
MNSIETTQPIIRDVVIEVPTLSQVKYEFDPVIGGIRLDRILHNSNAFPWNYGFLPNTMSPDSDPLDIFVLCNHALFPGTTATVRILGGIKTYDEKGLDHKLISVLTKDPEFSCYYTLNSLPNLYTSKIKYFLEHYKDGEKGKFINVDEHFYDNVIASQIIDEFTILPPIPDVD